MNYIQNAQIDAITMMAYNFRGNATIYNNILKTIDLNAEIPPPAGKGQITDLTCKIFSDPKYDTSKKKISEIILDIDKEKGTTIIKIIDLIKIFRPSDESLITPLYTKLSKMLETMPPEYIDNLISQTNDVQEKIKNMLNKMNMNEILNMIQNVLPKKGGKKRKRKTNKNRRKSRRSRKNSRR
jgi:hypothetical protein